MEFPTFKNFWAWYYSGFFNMMVSWFDVDSNDILSGKVRVAFFVLNLDKVSS